VSRATFEQSGARLAALRLVLADVGRHVVGQCVVAHRVPEKAQAGKPIELHATAGACVVELRGGFHIGDKKTWQPLRSPFHDGQATLELGTLPSSERVYFVEYFLGGTTQRGAQVGEIGSPVSPNRLLVEADLASGRPWYRRWWVWGLIGGIAAAGAVTAYYLTAPGTDACLGGGCH
jgi:hypothetical protein